MESGSGLGKVQSRNHGDSRSWRQRVFFLFLGEMSLRVQRYQITRGVRRSDKMRRVNQTWSWIVIHDWRRQWSSPGLNSKRSW
jgi:hypothetical protein